jgi:hypothetical protein
MAHGKKSCFLWSEVKKIWPPIVSWYLIVLGLFHTVRFLTATETDRIKIENGKIRNMVVYTSYSHYPFQSTDK